MKPPLEIEIKLRLDSPAKARTLLRRHGFRVIAPRVFEKNIVLDDERNSLRARSLLLRLREAGRTTTCTFKGPESPGRHKRRIEHEFTLARLDSCLAIFAALGYHQTWHYEKFRTEFARPGERGHATLDETPVGVFIELEGPARWIDRTAKDLGFSRDSWITASYARLYHEAGLLQ